MVGGEQQQHEQQQQQQQKQQQHEQQQQQQLSCSLEKEKLAPCSIAVKSISFEALYLMTSLPVTNEPLQGSEHAEYRASPVHVHG